MYGQVYLITNKINGKRYVGQTRRTLEERWKEHVWSSRRMQDERPLYRAIVKYGADSFTQETLVECDSPEQLNKDEDFYIIITGALEKGYNLRRGGNCTPMPDAVRRKMSASSLGKPKSESHCRNISLAYKEGRAIHADVSGEKNPFFGKKHSPETIARLTGRKVSEETRRKNSLAHQGDKGGRYRHDVSTDFLVEQYNAGISTYALEKIVGMDSAAILHRLKKAGVTIRTRKIE